MQSPPFEVLMSRIKSEYVEMPGLWLTADQAARLWALDRSRCVELLFALVEQRFLIVRSDGKYGRLADDLAGTRAAGIKAPLDA